MVCNGAARLALDPLDFALVADLVDATSDRSTPPLLVSRLERDPLGLSNFPVPGILDRIDPRKEREDSLVSDLLKDGYDCRPSAVDRSSAVEDALVGVLEPSRLLDGC